MEVSPLARETLPPGAVLVVAALAERSGAGALAFYLFLAGIAVSVACGLFALERVAGLAEARTAPRRDRLQVVCAAILVGVFFVCAAATSPVVAELRGAVPGLAGAAVVLGLLALATQAVAGLAGERHDDVRLDRRLLALDADAAERSHLRSVR